VNLGVVAPQSEDFGFARTDALLESVMNSTSLFINSRIRLRVSPTLISKLEPMFTVSPIAAGQRAKFNESRGRCR
jgi:hypothetical protein